MCLGALRGEHSLKVARSARAVQRFPHRVRECELATPMRRYGFASGGVPSVLWVRLPLRSMGKAYFWPFIVQPPAMGNRCVCTTLCWRAKESFPTPTAACGRSSPTACGSTAWPEAVRTVAGRVSRTATSTDPRGTRPQAWRPSPLYQTPMWRVVGQAWLGCHWLGCKGAQIFTQQ